MIVATITLFEVLKEENLSNFLSNMVELRKDYADGAAVWRKKQKCAPQNQNTCKAKEIEHTFAVSEYKEHVSRSSIATYESIVGSESFLHTKAN